jgi:hypothetical protein
LLLLGILNISQARALHKSKGVPELFSERLKNLEPFIYSFIVLTWKISWERKVLCLTVNQIKWKKQLWPKEMMCSKRIKLKQDFKICYLADLKINKNSPLIERVNKYLWTFTVTVFLYIYTYIYISIYLKAGNLFPTESKEVDLD